MAVTAPRGRSPYKKNVYRCALCDARCRPEDKRKCQDCRRNIRRRNGADDETQSQLTRFNGDVAAYEAHMLELIRLAEQELPVKQIVRGYGRVPE